MKTIHITSQDELPQVAGAIIGSLGRRTVVAFRGEMGAGKTTLIREIAAELGAADTVTSPTFACGKPSTSVTRSISTRETCVWWSGPRRSNSCCPTTR